jgi:hypothetical protein
MRALSLILLLQFASLHTALAQLDTPPPDSASQASQDETPNDSTPQATTAKGQPTPPPPQTARQALLEMFVAPKPGAFEKHLPEITRTTLLHGGDPAKSDVLREFVNFSAGFNSNRKNLETFDDGPILLSMEPSPGEERVEIAVERDDLMGDADEIELSIRAYKQGQQESLPVVPRATFTMKQENEVWKLSELAVTFRVPLADEEYLKGLKKRQDEAAENSAIAAVRTLNTAEITYAATYSDRGYTCNLAELGGLGKQPAADHAMLIDTILASGQRDGYKFSISGCDSRPSGKYQATAAPDDPNSGLRAFCSDEAAVVKYAADGTAATCLASGTPVQ